MKRGMNSRGQLTIFIIVAILVIALIAIFFIYREKAPVEKSSSEVSPIYTKTLACLESTTEDGVKYIALNGGYYEIPEVNYFIYSTEETSYYYMNKKKTIPSIQIIQRELEKYIIDNIKYCVNITSFEEQGFSVNEGTLKVSVITNEKEIEVEANYPLTVSKGEDTSILGEFKTTIPSNIERVYYASVDILNSYSGKPGFVCLTCLDEISSRYNVKAKATPLSDDGVIWFSILDSEEELNWRFVVEQ